MTLFAAASDGFAVLLAGSIGAVLLRVAVVGRRAKSLRYESLEGEIGRATSALNPEGWVRLRGALQRASSPTPVAAGERIIVLRDGFPLPVKPLEF